MIRVVVMDDLPVVRAAMRLVLDAVGCVIAQRACGADALRLVAEQRPGVLVLDVNLPDLSDREAIRRQRAGGTTPPILALAVAGLLEAVAGGCLFRPEAPEIPVSAECAAAREDSRAEPAVARQVVRRAIERFPPVRQPSPDLTPRKVQEHHPLLSSRS